MLKVSKKGYKHTFIKSCVRDYKYWELPPVNCPGVSVENDNPIVTDRGHSWKGEGRTLVIQSNPTPQLKNLILW